MDPRPLSFFCEAASGELVRGANVTASRLVTDSRTVRTGDLFLALRGDRFDGHDYLNQTATRGAVGAIVKRDRIPKDFSAALIGVGDTRVALGQIGAAYRRQMPARAVAVAGSNGKTTTKDLITGVLGQSFRTASSPASFNNDIGVPLTLLDLNASHEWAVLEIGTNHPGELAPLIEMIQPEIGVLTSIGREHLEFFGDLEGVAREEGVLAEKLPHSGSLVINADTPFAEQIARRASCRVLRVGTSDTADFQLRRIEVTATGTRFELRAPGDRAAIAFDLPLFGRHQALNAALAVAVGILAGAGIDSIREALRRARPSGKRLELESIGPIRLLNDSYNANPDSTVAALRVLRELPCSGRRIAVLGEMAELGPHAPAAHREIGGETARIGIDALLAVGELARQTAAGAHEAGLEAVRHCTDVDSAAAVLRDYLKPDDLILLKASRASRLERIGDQLRELFAPEKSHQPAAT